MALPKRTSPTSPSGVTTTPAVIYPEPPTAQFPGYFEDKYPEVVANFRALEEFNRLLLTALVKRDETL